MRSGRLLTERPPLSLMNEHGSTNLEKIILALAKSDAPSSSEVTPQQNRKISANSGRYVEEATSPTKLNDGKLQGNNDCENTIREVCRNYNMEQLIMALVIQR